MTTLRDILAEANAAAMAAAVARIPWEEVKTRLDATIEEAGKKREQS